MESLEHLHKQLENLGELHTIVRTMKALSAVSIRQYEQAARTLDLYYRTVERGLHVVLTQREPPRDTHSRHRGPLRLGAVVFGSDHGLCGRFNEEIVEYAIERMQANPAPVDNRLLLAIGTRTAMSLERAGTQVEDSLPLPGSTGQITQLVRQILLRIDAWREQDGVQDVFLFYNRRSTAGKHRPTGIELMPINLRRFHRLEEETWPSRALPTFSLAPEVLLSRLLHQYLFVSIFRACAESQASEHANRLATMQSAERNLDERVQELTLKFRRARQDLVTAELQDVVSGFEVVSQGRH